MAARLELLPQIAVVVDLAVEDDPDAAVLVLHRLMAAGAVDDGQPAVTERGVRIGKHPAAVRAAVPEAIGHRIDRGANIGVQCIRDRDHAADSTHDCIAPVSRRRVTTVVSSFAIALVPAQIPVHHPIDRKMPLDTPAGGLSHRVAQLRIAQQSGHGERQVPGRSRRHEQAGLAVDDHLGIAANVSGDHRQGRGHRLEHG